MPLWGKTDSAGARPSWYTTLENMDTAGRQLIFIDNTEATTEVNRARGFKSPGWWAYYTVEQSDGTLRYRGQECLVALSETAANAGDQADDAVAADAAPAAIAIDTQPSNVAGAADPTGAITFTVAASGGAGTLGYQWQYQTAASTTRWKNITDAGVYAGSDGPELGITDADKETYDGYKFRCRISDAGGALTVTSDGASLTFA